jgi:hypothetical protein
MPKTQENGTGILRALEDYKVTGVWGGEGRVVVITAVKDKQAKCHYCGSARRILYEQLFWQVGTLPASGDVPRDAYIFFRTWNTKKKSFL